VLERALLPGLEQVRITYSGSSAEALDRISPAILLVVEDSSRSGCAVYSVQTLPSRGEAGARVLSTSLLMNQSLVETVGRVATLAALGARHGRVFAGVAVYTPDDGRRIYLAELKEP
jgi:hypothetical protein